MDFEIISDIHFPESFAHGTGIRELPRLQKIYGKGRWRKCKGEATNKRVRVKLNFENMG